MCARGSNRQTFFLVCVLSQDQDFRSGSECRGYVVLIETVLVTVKGRKGKKENLPGDNEDVIK